MQYLHRLSLRLRSHICRRLAANPGTPFYPPLWNWGGDTPPGAVTAHQCGPTRMPDHLRRPQMATHCQCMDNTRILPRQHPPPLVDCLSMQRPSLFHRCWHASVLALAPGMSTLASNKHGRLQPWPRMQKIDNERPGLVLILAGSVCDIFIYFWHISTVS